MRTPNTESARDRDTSQNGMQTSVEESTPLTGVCERTEFGYTILYSARNPKVLRRVLFVNSYGGKSVWEKVKSRTIPAHHMWGCLELVQMGYEVALAEPLPDFYLHRRPLPHDGKLLSLIHNWLGADGIVYCGHNVLYWLPLLRGLSLIKNPIVSFLFGREPLKWARFHQGIIALNPAAESHARSLSPKSKIAHLSWGVDKTFFPALPYNPKFFLSCGRTQRDFRTLKSAAQGTAAKIQLLSPGPDANLDWSENVNVMTGGGVISQNSEIGYPDLIHKYYANTSAVLIVIKEDAAEATGVGFTNLIEAFAMGRPVIVTRTGAIATEIDIESAGVGLFVRPNSAEDLRSAMDVIASNSVNATAMATRALELSRKQYNIDRFAHQLHGFFSTF